MTRIQRFREHRVWRGDGGEPWDALERRACEAFDHWWGEHPEARILSVAVCESASFHGGHWIELVVVYA